MTTFQFILSDFYKFLFINFFKIFWHDFDAPHPGGARGQRPPPPCPPSLRHCVNIKLHDIINTNNTVHGLTYTINDLAQIMAQTVQIIT